MRYLAIIYHSAQGHTEHIASRIAEGAQQVANCEVGLLKSDDAASSPDILRRFDGIIFGSPTYLGGVSGPFKSFMDSTGSLWRKQQLRGKLAAGFTVSSLPAGDKQSTLLSMVVFAMQHGMFWVGNPILPEQHAGAPYNEAANRLGSWTGLMAQAGHGTPADGFAAGDVRTARLFGQTVAQVLHRVAPEVIS